MQKLLRDELKLRNVGLNILFQVIAFSQRIDAYLAVDAGDAEQSLVSNFG